MEMRLGDCLKSVASMLITVEAVVSRSRVMMIKIKDRRGHWWGAQRA